jgi:hypothetical protein
LVAGLVIVKLNVVVPFTAIVAGANAAAKDGGATTVSEALAVLPVPPSIEVTLTLLFLAPAVVPVTFRLKLQDAPAPSVPPDKLTEDDPARAVPAPVQVVVSALGVATTSPAGRLSVKATPVSAIAFSAVFETVKLKLVLPFRGMLAAPKLLVMLGGVPTVRLAVAVLPVPPLFDDTAPVVLL